MASWAAREVAEAVNRRRLAPPPASEPCVIHHSDYERLVAEPARRGVHAMYEAMVREAHADRQRTARIASGDDSTGNERERSAA